MSDIIYSLDLLVFAGAVFYLIKTTKDMVVLNLKKTQISEKEELIKRIESLESEMRSINLKNSLGKYP